MSKIYFDNAATTRPRPEVIAEMVRVLETEFGNPSSSHAFGRSARSVVELSRKAIARRLNCSAQEIIFTSGGTEADNWLLRSAVAGLGIKRIVTSRIEHHAVLHTIETLAGDEALVVDYVKVLPSGEIDLRDLEVLLKNDGPVLVSLMHVNNEIGTVLDLETVGGLCRQYGAFFHSDTVQSAGKEHIDLSSVPIDFMVASAHKFHGPKGIGFAFVRKGIGLPPLIFGGEQEKGLRAGTEAVHNIAGMSLAFDIAHERHEVEKAYISDLKQYLTARVLDAFPDAKVNGTRTFYNIVNICFPFSADKTAMILFTLDMKGIALSRGSACQSGSARPSHVLAEILSDEDIAKPSLRISFSHENTREEVDAFIEALRTV